MNISSLISTVDMHVSGEPLRIITSGLPEIKGETQAERRKYCQENLDFIRKTLMHEPRGHHGMYGCIITPPATENADFGVLFMHNEGWSTMCGHGIIAVVTMVLETGKYNFEDDNKEFLIDSPAGLIKAVAKSDSDGKVESVSFENVSSFVLAESYPVQIGDYKFTVDIAFGGAFYAIVDSMNLNLKITQDNLLEIQNWGEKIKEYIESREEVRHPTQNYLQGIYGVIFSDTAQSENADLRNVTIFADRQIDRSPCGTGTSAKIAVLHVKNELNQGKSFFHESITGGIFEGKVKGVTEVGGIQAVVPIITGDAYITGFHQFVIDVRDNLPTGFLL